MENTTMLLTGFVRRMQILDKEFRATQAAVEYVQKHCRQAEQAELEKAENEGNDLAMEEIQRINRLDGTFGKEIARTEQETAGQRRTELDRLIQCERLLAVVRNLDHIVIHQEELAGGKTSGSSQIRLDDLLSGKTDLARMAADVNEAYRAGRLRDAQNGYARLGTAKQEAERLLNGEIYKLRGSLAADQEKLRASCADVAQNTSGERHIALKECFARMDQQVEELARKRRMLSEQTAQGFENCQMKREERLNRITSSFLDQYPPIEFAEGCRELCEGEPSLEPFRPLTELPRMACLADMEYDLSKMDLCPDTVHFLKRYYPFLYRNGHLSLPCLLDFGGNGNFEFKYDTKQRSWAVKQACGLAMRLLTLLPPGKMKITFADPVTLGESFAGFARLADPDLDGVDFIGGRIWSSAEEIEQRLAGLTRHISDITQRCLQGRYKNLREYNETSDRDPEAYQVLILMDYPAGMTERSLQMLEQIVRHGPKCGVFTMIFQNEEQNRKIPDAWRPMISKIRTESRQLIIADNGEVRFDTARRLSRSIIWREKRQFSKEQMDSLIHTLWLSI